MVSGKRDEKSRGGDEPSAFSIIRGTLPSMTATAEFVVPKSMPMTWPLTFSSPPFELNRTNDDPSGARWKTDVRVEAEVALGSCKQMLLAKF